MLWLIVSTGNFTYTSRWLQLIFGVFFLVSANALYDSLRPQLKFARLFSGFFLCELFVFLIGAICFSVMLFLSSFLHTSFFNVTQLSSYGAQIMTPIVTIIASTFFVYLRGFGLFIWENASVLESPPVSRKKSLFEVPESYLA
ncbi:hypothetical protein DSO57_1028687 [Entomophthora muscae]|uniref:Uncharacterized protein n=1 Tax=Entomophthora muscae TaxID=34485 RepID=A0ACC2SER2_9FUNG|nr:hypothetical protein DSO57_1028687 [Entomophthora muscae]